MLSSNPAHVKETACDPIARLLADFVELPHESKKNIWATDREFLERYNSLSAEQRDQFDIRLCAHLLTELSSSLHKARNFNSHSDAPTKLVEQITDAFAVARSFFEFSHPKTGPAGQTAKAVYENLQHNLVETYERVLHHFQTSDPSIIGEQSCEEQAKLTNQIAFCLAILTAQQAVLFDGVRREEINPLDSLRLALSQINSSSAIIINGQTEKALYEKNHQKHGQHTISIETRCAQEIYADANILTATLFNLFKNAVQFNSNEQNSSLSLTVSNTVDQHCTVITIRNKSKTIELDRIQQSITEEYSDFSDGALDELRLQRKIFGGSDDTSLGLFMARSLIVDQLYGHISISNHPEGGSEVTILLPKGSRHTNDFELSIHTATSLDFRRRQRNKSPQKEEHI